MNAEPEHAAPGRHRRSAARNASTVGVGVHAVIRHSRPVELRLAHAEERAIAHRHLDLFVDGLRTHTEREVRK